MTATSVALEQKLPGLEFWSRFRAAIEQEIRESNAIAGEPLWEVNSPADERLQLTVQGRALPDQRLDCSFHQDRLMIKCARRQRRALEFHWAAAKPDSLRRGADTFTIYEAIQLILNQLTWPTA